MKYTLIITSCFLIGCGEAVFYKNLMVSSNNEDKPINAVTETADSLGYSVCSEVFCIDKTKYHVTHLDKSSVIVTFLHSFGYYPGPENKNVDKFIDQLESVCPTCEIKMNETSKWGFLENDKDWLRIYP